MERIDFSREYKKLLLPQIFEETNKLKQPSQEGLRKIYQQDMALLRKLGKMAKDYHPLEWNRVVAIKRLIEAMYKEMRLYQSKLRRLAKKYKTNLIGIN